jgi:hypothetical protein
MRPPPQLRTWLPWCILTQTPRETIDDFRNILRKYRKSSLLLGCARLSVVFNYGPEATTATNQDLALRWIPILFPPSLVPRLKEFAKQDWVIFFQGQLRFLAAEVIRLDPSPEGDLPVIENNALGELLLRAAELMYQPHPEPSDPLDKIANEVSRFLPIYEIDSPTDAIIPLLRFCTFLRIIIPNLPQALKAFDVGALFEKQFGFSVKLYTEFIFAFAVHAVGPHDVSLKSAPTKVESQLPPRPDEEAFPRAVTAPSLQAGDT